MLINSCSWESISGNESRIFVATSNLNGNTLLFPAGGVSDGSEIWNEEFGEYWSSELQPDTDNAYRLQISDDLVYCGSKYREDGRLLRPVINN